ncbi:MAG: 30S ribosomal protein S18 [Candidatus Scalindua sp.]|nr:30S ribosomal protein S18 [Candidatus Scalindua sp.]
MDRRKTNKISLQKKSKYAELTNKCRFCRMKMDEVDYKDLKYLQKLMGSQSRLLSKRRSGNCSTHQRSVKTALKRARFMALLPYVA